MAFYGLNLNILLKFNNRPDLRKLRNVFVEITYPNILDRISIFGILNKRISLERDPLG